MPERTWRILPRQSIVRALGKSIAAHFLTVLAAPAGYGKTTIAHSLAGQKHRRRIFHSIPDDVSSPEHWWAALCDTLAKHGVEQAPALRRTGFPRNDSMARRSIELLESASPPLFLILDDFHHFSDNRIDMFLEAWARTRPAHSRLVVLSRVKPGMRFDELSGLGLAATYDQAFVEFSEADAIRFFFLNGIADRKAARQAWLYSEGWVTALWLCLRNQRTGRKTPPASGVESLLDHAVFASYSPADRDFLMRLSVLGSCTAKEAEALTLDASAADRLRRMSDGNAFIRYDCSAGRYVFHSIFRDFLGKKVAASGEVNRPELYRRAAECHIRRGEPLPAFRLLDKAGRDEDKLRILDAILLGRLGNTYSVKRNEFLPIIEKIPWRLRLRRPLGYLVFVWLCFDDEIDDPLAVARFEEAARRFARAKEIPAYLKRRLAGEMEFMRGWIGTHGELHEIPRRYEKACDLLGGPSIIRYDRSCWNFGAPHMLFVYLPTGMRFLDEIDLLARACPSMSMLTGGVIEGCDLVASIEYRLERGEFAEAARLVNDLDQLLDFPWHMTSMIMAKFSRARLMSVEGKADAAAAMLGELLRDVEATDSHGHIQCAELALAYVLANNGQPDAAPRWLLDRDIFERPLGAERIQSFMVAVCGKLLLAKNDMDGLAAFLSSRHDIFGPVDLIFGGIHAAVFKAVLAWRRNREDEALRFARDAVERSRPDGFVLPLAEYGGHILPILRRLEKEAPGDSHLEAILETAERFDAGRRRRENKARHALTARECDIMRLAAKGKPTRSIAHGMGLSVAIVKHALSLAYKKLGAKNRAEAARLFQPASARPPRRLSGAGTERRAERPPPERRSVSAAGERMAGERLMRRGDLAGAFRHFLRAGRDEDLARSLDLFGLPGSGKAMAACFGEIGSAVQLFPWPVRLARPTAYLDYLWRYFRAFERGASGMELDEAEYRLSREAAGSPGGDAGLAGEIALLRSLLRAHDAQAFWKSHETALRLLNRPSRFYSPETSWTFGNPHFSFAAVRAPGGFGAMAGWIASASATLSALSGGVFTSLDAAFRLERHIEKGEADKARAILSEMAGRGDGDAQALVLAAFSEARLLLAEGRSDAAADSLERLVPRIRRLDSFELSESLELALGYVNAQLGRVEQVPEWIRSGNMHAPPHGATIRHPFALTVYGKALAASGNFASLESAARVMPTRFGRFDSLLGRVHAKVLEAVAAYHRRGEDEALAHLAVAVELSRRDGLVFSIAEYGELVLPLVRRLRRDRPGDAHARRLALAAERIHRRAANNGSGKRGAHGLTPREREIMRLVARGKTNAAIAMDLGVSVSRVARALSGIYRKFAVSNRTEACRRFEAEYGNA